MCHVIDEVVLHLRVALLPHDEPHGEAEREEEDEGEAHERHHRACHTAYVGVHLGKMHAQRTALGRGVVAE